jgi:hypothetical protein
MGQIERKQVKKKKMACAEKNTAGIARASWFCALARLPLPARLHLHVPPYLPAPGCPAQPCPALPCRTLPCPALPCPALLCHAPAASLYCPQRRPNSRSWSMPCRCATAGRMVCVRKPASASACQRRSGGLPPDVCRTMLTTLERDVYKRMDMRPPLLLTPLLVLLALAPPAPDDAAVAEVVGVGVGLAFTALLLRGDPPEAAAGAAHSPPPCTCRQGSRGTRTCAKSGWRGSRVCKHSPLQLS